MQRGGASVVFVEVLVDFEEVGIAVDMGTQRAAQRW